MSPLWRVFLTGEAPMETGNDGWPQRPRPPVLEILSLWMWRLNLVGAIATLFWDVGPGLVIAWITAFLMLVSYEVTVLKRHHRHAFEWSVYATRKQATHVKGCQQAVVVALEGSRLANEALNRITRPRPTIPDPGAN